MANAEGSRAPMSDFQFVCSRFSVKMLWMPASENRAPSALFRRRRITIALVACGAVGIVCFFTLRSSEPSYRDKSLSQWVERLFANYPRRDSEAREALRAMGQP